MAQPEISGAESGARLEFIPEMSEDLLATQANHCLSAYLFHNFPGKLGDGHGREYIIRLEPEVEVGRGKDITIANNANARHSSIIERSANLKALEQLHVYFDDLDSLELTFDHKAQRWNDWYSTVGVNLGHALDRQAWDVYQAGAGLSFGSATELISPGNVLTCASTLQSVPLPTSNQDIVIVVDRMTFDIWRRLFGGPVKQDDSKGSGGGIVWGEKFLQPLALSKAYMGKLYGMYPVYVTDNLPPYSPGTWTGTPLMDGANQQGDSINTDGWTSGDFLNAGAIIEIAGVGFVNMKNKDNVIMDKATFTVMEKATADSSGDMTIKISPEIYFNRDFSETPGTSTAVNSKAYDNVTALNLDNAAITVKGTSGSTYRQAFVFNEMSTYRRGLELNRIYIGENTRLESSKYVYLSKPGVTGGPGGLGFSIWCGIDGVITDRSSKIRFDTIQACSVIRGMYGGKVWGTRSVPNYASLTTS